MTRITHDREYDWDAAHWDWSETACDGCGERLAARAPRVVQYGPVGIDHRATLPAKVFHRPECATAYWDRQIIEAGLADIAP